MEYTTNFSVRYDTGTAVPIKDIISSLQAIEASLTETARLLPSFIDGLAVQKIDIRVQEIAQNSPLREAFAVALLMTYQEQLTKEVPQLIGEATGWSVPHRFDTLVTVITLIVIFYGASALKELVAGHVNPGRAEAQLTALIDELSTMTGKSGASIRRVLDDRYAEKTMWRRLINTASRFFTPSKQQDSAPIDVNERHFDRDLIKEVPAEFIVDDAAENRPSRTFDGAEIELHAQDRDHRGRGWAAVVPAVSGERVRLKLMEGVHAEDLWNRDRVHADIVVVYDRMGTALVPKEVHLHRISAPGG